MAAPKLLFNVIGKLDPAGPMAGVGVSGKSQARVIVPYTGGSFEGPAGSGRVLPGGGDYILLDGASGKAEMDIRIHLVTADGVAVYGTCSGVLSMTQADWDKFNAGNLDIAPLKSIGHWRFETDSSSKYGYLNSVVAVGKVAVLEVEGGPAACWAIYDISNETLEGHPLSRKSTL